MIKSPIQFVFETFRFECILLFSSVENTNIVVAIFIGFDDFKFTFVNFEFNVF